MPSDNIKYFDAPVTGRRIAVNAHPTDFAWAVRPTTDEVLSVIAEHERIAIAKAWERWSVVEKGKSRLWAFKPSPAGNGSFRWLRGAHVARVAGLPSRGPELGAVAKLPIEEQRRVFMALLPTSRHELEGVATAPGVEIFIGKLDMKAAFLASGSPEKFTDVLNASRESGARELLIMLRARGWLLFPSAYASEVNNVKWAALLTPEFGGPLTALANEIIAHVGMKRASMVTRFGWVALLMSSVVEVQDMSLPWMDEMESRYREWLKVSHLPTALGYERGGEALGRALRGMWNHRFPNNQLRYKPHGQTLAVRKGDGSFRWLIKDAPELALWVEPLAAFVGQRSGTTTSQVVGQLNRFCTFLSKHPAPPATPEAVVRLLHINDVTLKNRGTLFEWLSTDKGDPKAKSLLLSYVREFFDWYPDWLRSNGRDAEAARLMNPISVQDKFKKGNGPGQTFRTALPSWLLKELRATLTEDDFVFMRGQPAQTVTVYDRESGQGVDEWWPGISVLLLLLLELPLRSHQGRWLDSGVLDEFVTDVTAHTLTKNESPYAIAKRREGCLRLLHDTLRQESWVALFINTNKTAVYDGHSPVGYEIPYLPQLVMEQLQRMAQWGLRYMPPITTPLRYKEGADIRKSSMKVNLAGSKLLPTIAPLFADPRAADKREPVSYNRLTRAYVALLAETEKRINAKYNTGIVLTEMKLVEGRLRPTWKYDLHTLRVSGISAMLENGVPLEVVSQFVAGHATLVMTLWYYKNSPGKLRELIADHHDRSEAESDFVGSAQFAEHVDKFSPFLLSKQIGDRGEGQDAAFEAMKAHTGLWTISSDGICPGTGCSTGGEKDSAGLEFGPVPGGRRCGLCRYWITGPAFILGQVAECNNLIYQIRRKGQELSQQRDALIEQTDSGALSKARQIKHHIEALERELTIDLKEWQSRYAYAMASSGLLDDYILAREQLTSDSNLPAPLLTASSAAELKLTLQECDEFVLLDHVTQMVDFLPGFKNREAVHEQHLVLSKVLESNGLPQFLLRLDPKKAETAANMMSSLILEYVKAQDLPRVLSGELKIDCIPDLNMKVKELAYAPLSGPFVPLTVSGRKVIPISRA